MKNQIRSKTRNYWTPRHKIVFGVLFLISVRMCSNDSSGGKNQRAGNPSILKKKSPSPQPEKTPPGTQSQNQPSNPPNSPVVTPKNATLLDFKDYVKSDPILKNFYYEYSLINEFAPQENSKSKYLIYGTNRYGDDGEIFDFFIF